jgi:ABC-type transporter Mla subunit MlaD
VQAELHDLVLRASLEFAKNRAVTPEELSAGINEAAVKLGEGLSNLRQAFDDTTELVREVQGVTGTIADSASALKSASDSLVDVMKPLTNFGQSAESAADLLRSTADAVDFARMTFETSMAGAGQVLSEELKSHAQTMENVRDAVTGVSNSVIRATTGLQQVVEGSGTAATKVNSLVGNLSGVSDNIALAASSLSSVVKTLVEANRTMGEIAESANSQEVTSYIEAVRNHAEAMVNGAMAVESAVRVLGEELGNWGEGRNRLAFCRFSSDAGLCIS